MEYISTKTRYKQKKLQRTMFSYGILLLLVLALVFLPSTVAEARKRAYGPTLSVFPITITNTTNATPPANSSETDVPFLSETDVPFLPETDVPFLPETDVPFLNDFPTSTTTTTSLTGELPLQIKVTVVTDDLTQPIITIEADQIESDQNTNLSHFLGRVSIKRGVETITGDRAIWNNEANTVEISGNISMVTPDFKIIAQRAVVNLDLYLAKIYDGKAFFPSQNYYLSGAVIERVGENTMHIKDGTATTCDGPNPPWTIQAKELTVTEGGYAKASGVTFNTKYAPVAYVPWMMFPVKNERQSGFLLPTVGNSSRDGFVASLPVFWATGENHDLTFLPVWRGKRGLSTTLEGRYHLEEGRGIWAFTHLKDQEHKSFYYRDNATTGQQETGDRYWLRAQNQWHLGDWDINLDLDIVSDPLYLAEFRDEPDGFNYSATLFSQEFGNTVNEYLDSRRSNTLFAQKTAYDTLIRAGLDYTDDLYSKDNHDTVQRLPSIHYAMVGRPLGLSGSDSGGLSSDSGNPLRFSMDMHYDYFYRTTNQNSPSDETGHRMVLSPSLGWSQSLGDMATLQLGGDMNLTMYSADGYRTLTGNLDPDPDPDRERERHKSFDSRLTSTLTGSLSTTFSRVFEGGPGEATAFRHQMTPSMSFTYIEAPDHQDDLPYWDFMDRQLSRKTMRYGLQNTFVSKTPNQSKVSSLSSYNYFQFFKIGLWNSYELTDHLDWGRNPEVRQLTTDYYEKGIGPVELDMEAFFNPYFSMRLISAMDGQTGDITSHDLSFRAQTPRGDSLSVAYDFDTIKSNQGREEDSEYEEIRSYLGLVLGAGWRANISSRYDMRDGTSLETKAALMYQAQCYGLGLLYTDNRNERRMGVVVDLLGLGSINDSIARFDQ